MSNIVGSQALQGSTSASPRTGDALGYPILIGDIGGTNARFAVLTDAYADAREFPAVRTADFATIEDAIQAAVLDKTSVQPRSAILAVAGPVDGDAIDLTNCHWVVRPRDLIAGLAFSDVIVVNDFEAQALAVADMAPEHLVELGRGRAENNQTRVVLGPGTGLGVGALVRAGRVWVPVPGEGGHVDLGPRTERDHEVWPHIERVNGRVSAEQVLCGPGIERLYRAVCAADGAETHFASAADITAAAVARSNGQAQETLDLFSTYLGRVAGDLALIFMATGGVFVSGGIGQHIVGILKSGLFRAAFEDKAPHSELIASIATRLIIHPLAPLAGLSAFARTPSRFAVELSGRRWRG